MLMSSKTLAQFASVSAQTITNWVKEGLPVESENPRMFDSVKFFQWHLARKKAQTKKDTLLNEQVRLFRAKADQQETRNAELASGLLPIEVVEEEYAKMRETLHKHIQAIPTKRTQELAALEEPAQVQLVLQDICNQALHDIVDDFRKHRDSHR